MLHYCAILCSLYWMIYFVLLRKCVVPRVHSGVSNISFNIAGPFVWNSLPPQLCEDIICEHFKWLLIIFLFGS